MKNYQDIQDFFIEVVQFTLFFLAIHLPLRVFGFVSSDHSLLMIVIYSVFLLALFMGLRSYKKISLLTMFLFSGGLIVYYFNGINYEKSSVSQIITGLIFALIYLFVTSYRFFYSFAEDREPTDNPVLEKRETIGRPVPKKGWRRKSRRLRAKSSLKTKLSSGKYRG